MKPAIAMLVVVMGCGGVMGQTSVEVTVLPPNSVKSFETTGDGKCPDGYSKQKSSGFNAAGEQVDKTRYDCVEQPKPLKCDKYFHVSHACKNPMDACIDITGHCDPDLHIVTEKEWQLQMESNTNLLKSMEAAAAELKALRLAMAAQWEEIKQLKAKP